MEKDCNNCKFELYNPDEIPCKDCGMDDREYWQPKPQTNADRIRAMSDEQLAGIVHAVYLAEDCPFSSADCENCLFRKICGGNYKTESEWLKQPAEGE